jgi:hypothetical protein
MPVPGGMLLARKSFPIPCLESLSPLHERGPAFKINKERTIKIIENNKKADPWVNALIALYRREQQMKQV